MTKTYAQLAREIEALRAVAQKQLALEIKSAVEKINEVIARYGLTAGDLTFRTEPAPTPVSAAGSALATAPTRKAAVNVTAKYRDPASGLAWSGRGPRPQWLKQALKKRGSAIEDFLVSEAPSSSASLPTPVSPSPAVKQARPAQRAPQKARPAAKPGGKEEVAAPKAAVKKAAAKTAAKRGGQGAPGAASEVKAPVKQAARKAIVQQAARKKFTARKARNVAATASSAATRAGLEAPAQEPVLAKEAPAAQAASETRVAPAAGTPETRAAAASVTAGDLNNPAA